MTRSLKIPAASRPETEPVVRTMRAIGTTATVAVTDPRDATRAELILGDELAAIDATCSRFRPDSELWNIHYAGGSAVQVSPLLFEAIAVACAVAEHTGGAVDPTVGVAIEALGYDRDFEELAPDGGGREGATKPAPGWWRIELDADRRIVRVPAGVHLDLGSSAKALTSDRVVTRIAGGARGGVLVSIGGDVAIAGPAPRGGWAIGIAEDSSAPTDGVDQVVAIRGGGLASSSTTVRRWCRDGHQHHHILDPATGKSADPYWRLVSTTGKSCVEANAAATAAIVWGPEAPDRLASMGQPARLVRHDGQVVTVNSWPESAAGAREARAAQR